MFEQDYLMRMLMQFFQALARSNQLKEEEGDPLAAADLLEDAIGTAVEMDGSVLLSLAPESIAQVMKVSGTDPNVMQFVARSMLLQSVYLNEAGKQSLALVRSEQARALADAYGFTLPADPSDFDSITEGLEEAAEAGGFFTDAADHLNVDEQVDSLDDLLGSLGVSLDEPLD